MSVQMDISREEIISFIREKMINLDISQLSIAQSLDLSTGTISNFFSPSKMDRKTFNRHLSGVIKILMFKLEDDFYNHLTQSLSGKPSASRFCLEIGNTETLWYCAIATFLPGREGISSDYSIKLTLDKTSFIRRLNMDLELRDAVDKTKRGRELGFYHYENNDLLYITDGNFWPPKGEDERLHLDINVLPHEYALFYTLTSTEHGRSLLKRRMENWKRGDIIPELAGGLGINVAIMANDGAFIFGRRHSSQGPRKEQLDVGAVEGFSVKNDIINRGYEYKNGVEFEVDWVAKRALEEEYGITADKIKDLHILGFGLDMQYSQWNVIALSYVDIPGTSISRKNKYAPNGHEFLETYPIYGGPKYVFKKIDDDPLQMWSCGIAVAYFAMVHIYGEDAADAGIARRNLRRQDKTF